MFPGSSSSFQRAIEVFSSNQDTLHPVALMLQVLMRHLVFYKGLPAGSSRLGHGCSGTLCIQYDVAMSVLPCYMYGPCRNPNCNCIMQTGVPVWKLASHIKIDVFSRV